MKSGTRMPRASDQSTQGRLATERTVSDNCQSSFLASPIFPGKLFCWSHQNIWGIPSQGPSH